MSNTCYTWVSAPLCGVGIPQGVTLGALLLLLVCCIRSHNIFLKRFQTHMTSIYEGPAADAQKIVGLLKAPDYVPIWRLSIVSAGAFTIMFAVITCLCRPQRSDTPGIWLLLYILFFLCSYLPQCHRSCHTANHARNMVQRLLDPASIQPSFWDEFELVQVREA
jgi:hypothetical protein